MCVWYHNRPQFLWSGEGEGGEGGEEGGGEEDTGKMRGGRGGRRVEEEMGMLRRGRRWERGR